MKIFKILFVNICILLISCITDPDDKENRNNNISVIFPEGRTLVYSLYEINKVDSTALNDSSIGVMVISVDKVDSIRLTQVHRWTIKTEYFSGKSHPIDSVFTSYEYIEESDSFLLYRAYPTKYVSNSGVLMKRTLCDQTDSISANGDSVQIENVDVKTFCKTPYVGLKWIQRPTWLEYEIIQKEGIYLGSEYFDCFKINATPLDSHCTIRNPSSYQQNSWVTTDKIIKTIISHSLPDSIWSIPNFTRIEILDDIPDSKGAIKPSIYKINAMQRGWN